MTGSSCLLDTNAAIDLLNRSPKIASRVGALGSLRLPLPVLGELEGGARKSTMRAKNLDSIERLLKETILMIPDRETAAIYGEIDARLRRLGKPIPINDIWIAALGIQHQLPLLTLDKHFDHIEDLVVLSW